MAGTEKDNKMALTEKQIEDLKGAFETQNFSQLANQLQEALQALENISLNMGIIGESGGDKSAFINTFRDLYEEDEGAAPTGKVEASKTPLAYPHPKYPNVILWDLPNIGTPDCQAKSYVEQMNVARYDFFIIIASGHFSSLHAKLARYIKKAGKDYFFVRSKVDADLESVRQSNPSSFNEIITLQEIRERCVQDLKTGKTKPPRIFLISNIVLSKYDFYLLGDTLRKNLDLQRSNSFLLATPNISHRILEKKKNMMVENLWLVAVMACNIQSEPIPEILVVCDVGFLVKTMQAYCITFGLEEESLRKTAEHAGQPFEQLKALVRSPLAFAITKAQVVELLTKAACKAPKLPRQLVPMAAVGLSFAVVYGMLKAFVEDVAADAHRVLVKVFMSHNRSESDVAMSSTSTFNE